MSNLSATIHTYFGAFRYASAVLIFIFIAQATVSAQNLAEKPDDAQQQQLANIFERDADPEKTTQAFYGALERLRAEFEKNEAVLKQAYLDVIDILPVEMEKAWHALQANDKKVTFVREFWLANDYTPATVVNERLIEHYQRLRHARMRYSWINPKGYDDRGTIYIKYGEPDNFVDEVMNTNAVPVSTWAYYRHGSPVTFDFINEGYGYTLNSNLSDAVRSFTPGAEATGVLDLVERRIELSPEYARLYFELQRLYNEYISDPNQIRARFLHRISEHTTEMESKHSLLPPSTTDVLTELKDLPCALSLAKFRGAEGKLDLAATYGFRPADLEAKRDTLEVRVKTALRAGNREVLLSTDAPYTFIRTGSLAEQEFLQTESFSLLPSEYFFALEIDHPAGKQKGLRDFSVTLGKYPEDEMCLSSAIFATQVEPATQKPDDPAIMIRHDLAIAPFPYTIFSRQLPLFIYFEIYSLQKDEAGATYIDIEYKVKSPGKKGLSAFLASLNPFAGKASSIAFSDVRHGTSATEPTYLQLDLRQLEPGKYEFILNVTDRISGVSKERMLEFELDE